MDTEAGYVKAAGSSLKLHTDRPGDLRGQVLGLAQGVGGRPGLVVSHVAGVERAHPPHKDFSTLSGEEYKVYGPAARAVGAAAGSLVVWRDTVVHGNCGDGHTLPVVEGVAEVSCAEAAFDPARVHALVGEHGYCVITEVLSEAEAKRLTAGCVEAVKASRRDAGNGFKGPRGSSLWKMYGVSTHAAVRWVSVHANVLMVWSALIFGDASRVDELCMSPDALAFSARDGGRYDAIERPTRATVLLCYGDRSQQEVGTGARKLAWYMSGGTCNHPPTRFSKGGRGSHMSNGGPAEKRWVAQRPAALDETTIVDECFVYLLGP